MLPRINNIMPDSGPGQMRLPADLGAFQVVRTVESEEGQKIDLEPFKTRLHQALEHILKRGDKALVTAIQTNLEQFSRLVKTEERLRALEEQVNILLGKHKKTAMER